MYNYLREAGTPRSWLISCLFATVCGGASAYANLADASWIDMSGQPRWMLELHIGAAALGALLIARFVSSALSAIFTLPDNTVYATGKLANGSAIRYRVDLKENFFSAARFLQVLGFVLCVMVQGVTVTSDASAGRPANAAPRPARIHSGMLST
ncbi:hypothetical protein [Paraburkholderia azotifigens]|uniref:Uncharacterized protein n=1 Tax=Paraburkholderia azotifigens TaxID=2057004 RepID=A0A5C6VBZ6_9BURK|nr:hypothetical protein [Paraburkholderia azotifigens]TXC82863.1 hypothetical protein FRZ40_20790 [Paraburkholderia azotifigens]